MQDNPCYGCTRRFPGCQDTCPDGMAWSEKNKARREKIRMARKKETDASSTIIELKEKVKRK